MSHVVLQCRSSTNQGCWVTTWIDAVLRSAQLSRAGGQQCWIDSLSQQRHGLGELDGSVGLEFGPPVSTGDFARFCRTRAANHAELKSHSGVLPTIEAADCPSTSQLQSPLKGCCSRLVAPHRDRTC